MISGKNVELWTPRLALKHLHWSLITYYWWYVFHPICAFKRWMWTRCAGCGGVMPFGYAPDFDGFAQESRGPGWFKGEQHTYHSPCMRKLNARRREDLR